jgi:hypothetical protein
MRLERLSGSSLLVPRLAARDACHGATGSDDTGSRYQLQVVLIVCDNHTANARHLLELEIRSA